MPVARGADVDVPADRRAETVCDVRNGGAERRVVRAEGVAVQVAVLARRRPRAVGVEEVVPAR